MASTSTHASLYPELGAEKTEEPRTQDAARAQKALSRFSGSVVSSLRYGPEAAEMHKGGKYRKLWAMHDPQDREFIESLHQTYPSRATGALILMPNREKANPADPGGYALQLHKDAPFVADDVLHPTEPFGATMICRIIDDHKLHDSSLRKAASTRMRSSMKSLHEHAKGSFPSIAAHFDRAHPEHDKAEWTPVLTPGTDSRVGVYTTRTAKGNQIYFLLCSTSAGPVIGRELREIVDRETPTAGQFASDDRVRWARSVGDRNCARLLQHAADSLGVRIDSAVDFQGHRAEHVDRPLMAVPAAHVAFNTFQKSPQHPDASLRNDTVVFFKNCGSGMASKRSTIVLGDRADPVFEIEGAQHAGDPYGLAASQHVENRLFGALPTHTSSIDSETAAEMRQSMGTPSIDRIQALVMPLQSDASSAASSSDRLVAKSYANRVQFKDDTLSKHIKDVPGVLKQYGLGEHARQTRSYKPIAVCVL